MNEENDLIMFDDTARAKLAKGVSILAKAVGVTLGPKGRNVVIDHRYDDPRITKDGVTVAREVKVSDHYENIGVRIARGAAEKQLEEAGDGTTTVTVLTDAIVSGSIKLIAAGFNPMDLKRGIDHASKLICNKLKDSAVAVTEGDVYKIALVSSNGDTEIALKIDEAIKEVGKFGILTVEEWPLPEVGLEVLDGLMFDRGYYHDKFVNTENYNCELENPIILIFDGKMAHLNTISAFLDEVIRNGRRPILLIAETFEDEVLNTLILNKTSRNYPICAVKTPAFGKLKDELLGDIGVMVGTEVFGARATKTLENVRMIDGGTARRVIIGRKNTLIVGGGGSKEAIQNRCRMLEEELKTASGNEKRNLEIRLASLNGGIGVLKAGGSTALEIKEKKDRIDDAICAVKCAINSGILPGGGAALVNAAKTIEMPEGEGEGFEAGYKLVQSSISAPLNLIASNSGYNGDLVVTSVKNSVGFPEFGFNARNGQYVDLIKAGVIDPALVVISAMRNASSVAGLLITTECILKKEEIINDL